MNILEILSAQAPAPSAAAAAATAAPGCDEEMTDATSAKPAAAAAADPTRDPPGSATPPGMPTKGGALRADGKASGGLDCGAASSTISTADTAESACLTCRDDEEMVTAGSSCSPASAASSRSRAVAWLPRTKSSWESRYVQLRDFLSENGHCNVPQQHPTLGRWVSDQRAQYNRWERGQTSPMTPERRRLLQDLGFVWNPYEAVWFERVADLARFRAEHGHYNVPQRGGDDDRLGKWVNDQRTQYGKWREGKRTNLTDERRAVLDGMDFTWNAKEAAWYERYEELKNFKAAHGHCKVPIRENQLGRWVDKQRSGNRRMELSDERKNALDELGFSWDLRRKGPLSKNSMKRRQEG